MSMVPRRVPNDAPEPILTSAEKRRLSRILQPVSRRLHHVAAANLKGFYTLIGEDIVNDACLSFSISAAQDELKCLGCRRIADIEDDELGPYIRRCHGYLAAIVVRKCCDYHRRVESRPQFVAEWDESTLLGDPDPASEMIRRERDERIREAANHLPVRLYRVLVLRFDGEQSEEEIAASLGISVRTVQRCLHEIREQLGKELSADMTLDI